MKQAATLLIVWILLAIPTGALAQIGCRDNSWHLEKRYDYKEDHPVACLCPCPDTIERCIQCGHYHAPKPWIIINEPETVEKKAENTEYQHPYALLKQLAQQYRKTHGS